MMKKESLNEEKVKDINMPNKKMEIVGSIILYIGLIMILLTLFGVLKGHFIVIGIFVCICGLSAYASGKLGLEKAVEASMTVEKMKVREIAKGIKEGLKDDDFKDAE